MRKPKVGDLVRIVHAWNQPQWIRDLADEGKTGILVEIGSASNFYGRRVLLIDGEILPGFHDPELEVV